MSDKRKRPRLKAPTNSDYNAVTAFLTAEDYRRFYDVVMERGTSGSEAIRQLIREAHATMTSETGEA